MHGCNGMAEGHCHASAAIVKPKAGPCNGKLFTEEDWNDESTLTDGPYRFSKVGEGCLLWPE